ncbi:DUF2878 domain-containing protein [Marinomonas sp. M1K-6]|uniref:DUF2878 domain-containing protein n=1 Tax=Marinomonas profundi TaxID=2726122 RepID=A0A847R4E8_9GAMM|nr:DUF2878 domain-containing protein [Marinomonas profundi]NLQ18861.1 DUF2878 domain-containing protein [Marinomonas profundi]UDV01788.1 DUF2878 domain-containing protein [Marinomonas profundi]
MKPLLNAILFQIVWFVCLLAGNVWALAVTVLYLFLHDRYFMRTRREWRLLLVFLMLGVVVDGTLFQLGVFSSSAGGASVMNSLPPIWLLCLWVCVATLFAHSLALLRFRYALSALMGAIGPTFSYFAGAKLAGIHLADPIWLTLLMVAIIWALVLTLGVWLADKWSLFENQGQIK